MKPYLPPDKRAQQILIKIERSLPSDMPNRKLYALMLGKLFVKNTKSVLEFTAASFKDRIYWEVVEQKMSIL